MTPRAGPAPHSLRRRLFIGITATVVVSVAVTLAVGALLTRRSLDEDARVTLARQVALLARQHEVSPLSGGGSTEIGRFLATEQQRLAILTLAQANLLLPPAGAATLKAQGSAQGKVDVQGEPFLYAARAAGGDAVILLRSERNESADWRPFFAGLGIAGLVGVGLAAVVALGLARAVARPVSRVADASRRLAAGESPDPLRVEGPVEVQQLATAFNELSEELRVAQDAERAFLLSVSHELKTPLTAILGHAEALTDGVVEPERGGSVIEREARRLERLVQDLLDLARLRRRSFSVSLRPVDLGAVALDAVARYEPQSRSFGVTLDAVVQPDAGALADPDRTLQALSNLVENALRTTPPGGVVRIVASRGRLDVVDNGPGLAAGDLERAFERFYLWDRYAADRPVGTGLGLAIVAELTRAMGGEVAVASEPGRGSTFTLRLPGADLPDPGEAREPPYVRLTQR